MVGVKLQYSKAPFDRSFYVYLKAKLLSHIHRPIDVTTAITAVIGTGAEGPTEMAV